MNRDTTESDLWNFNIPTEVVLVRPRNENQSSVEVVIPRDATTGSLDIGTSQIAIQIEDVRANIGDSLNVYVENIFFEVNFGGSEAAVSLSILPFKSVMAWYDERLQKNWPTLICKADFSGINLISGMTGFLMHGNPVFFCLYGLVGKKIM